MKLAGEPKAQALSPKVTARLAGLLYLGCGGLGAILLVGTEVAGNDKSALIGVMGSTQIIAVFALLAPWNRWHPRANLVLAVIAFAMVFMTGKIDLGIPHIYGAMSIMIFMWIGIAHPPGTSLYMAPLALLAFVEPLSQRPEGGQTIGELALSLVVLPMGLMVGEAIATVSRRLRSAEQINHERLADLNALVAVSETLAQQQDSSLLPDHISEMALGPLSATAALVTFIEADGSLLGAGSKNWPKDHHQVLLKPWTIPSLHHVLTSNALSTITEPDQLGCPSAVAVPIKGSGETIGVLFLIMENPNDAFVQDLAHTFATQAGLALERSWTTQTLIDETLRDELTGIGNRRHATAILARLQVGDAVAMIDLDHFKIVNDSWGHSYGDEVLKLLSTYLQSQMREDDHLARYGGEEFLLILHRSGPDASQTMERLREGWSEQHPSTTFSAGIAVHQAGVLPNHTLESADHALYAAKKAGRNRTHVHTPAKHHVEATDIHHQDI